MTYVHFELLLIFGNKYSMGDQIHTERERESLETIQRPKERSFVMGLYVSIYSLCPRVTTVVRSII